LFFFFQAEDGIRDFHVTGVQTCALPICPVYCASAVTRRKRSKESCTATGYDSSGRPGAKPKLSLVHGRPCLIGVGVAGAGVFGRSEERRVGKECRARGATE